MIRKSVVDRSEFDSSFINGISLTSKSLKTTDVIIPVKTDNYLHFSQHRLPGTESFIHTTSSIT